MKNDRENTKMNLLHKTFNSITNLNRYSYFCESSLGKAILYLFLISVSFGIFGAARETMETNFEIYDLVQVYNKKITDVQIKDGQLKIDGKMPIVISNRNNNYYIIDTSGKTDQSVLNSYDRGVLILKDKLIQKIDQQNTLVTNFASLGSITITKDTINGYLPLIRHIPLFIIIRTIVRYFMGGILVAAAVSICTLILDAKLKTNLGFENIYKISIYSLTTPLLINSILSMLKLNIPYWSLIYVLTTLVFTILVIKYHEKQTFKYNNLFVN